MCGGPPNDPFGGGRWRSHRAILVIERTSAKPLRDAIIDSGGILTGKMRLPGEAVEDLLDELAALA